MTYAIHALKDENSVVTVRISSAAAVDKARLLEAISSQVHITDSADTSLTPETSVWLLGLNAIPHNAPFQSTNGEPPQRAIAADPLPKS